MNETEQRQLLVEQYQKLASLGLTEQSSGNISIRTDKGMLISPSGISADTITPSSVVLVNPEGDWQGRYKPSSEWQMHAAIYHSMPASSAIVHTHSDHCVALASLIMPLPGFHYLVGTFGGTDVRCTDYYTFGTQSLADAAVTALDGRTACLLGNHGMISHGPDLGTAVDSAHRLEILCRQYLLARQLGEPRLLNPAEWLEFRKQFDDLEYGQQS